jgi:hypothetical protein
MKVFISFLCVFFSFNCYSQRLDPKEVQAAVQGIAKHIENNYVFPEKGKRIAKHILQVHKNGSFAQCKDWKMFDSLATYQLRSFSYDGHLYVQYDPETVRELLAEENKVADTTRPFSYDPFYYGQQAIENNFGFRDVKVMDKNIGYIQLSQINISVKSLPALYGAMRFVAHTKALIIDLRNNGGGGSEAGPVFESFFLPKDVPLLEFKTRHGQTRLDKSVTWLTEPKYENPLYILVNSGTASAAEAFAYALQHTKRAIIVGQPSAGAAHMNSWYVVNDYIFVSVSTAAPAKPGTEESWEQKGVQPDHVTEKGKEIEYVLQVLN